MLRGYWLTLDRGYDDEPAYQTLLENVQDVEFFAVDQMNNEHDYWPLDLEGADASPQNEELYLTAIILRLDIAPYGVIERIWRVPSV